MKTFVLKTHIESETKIRIGNDIKAQIQADLASFNPSQIVCITDATMQQAACDYLHLNKNQLFVIPSGEEQKNFENLQNIVSFLIEKNVDKKSLVVGFGGGVITDLAGFAASIFYRGVPVVYIPTTLLAQVDAAIGGKTAVNFHGIKNIIGTITQPDMIVVDVGLLSSLPERQLRSGFGEIIKYGLAFDRQLYKLLQNNVETRHSSSLQIQIIERCIQIKSAIIQTDPTESKGERKLLNFGHTLGHALEANSKFDLTHGEAIAIGQCFAAWVSHKEGSISAAELEQTKQLFQKYNLPISEKFDVDEILKKIAYDKKRSGDKIEYILLKRIGESYIKKLSITELKNYLIEFQNK